MLRRLWCKLTRRGSRIYIYDERTIKPAPHEPTNFTREQAREAVRRSSHAQGHSDGA